MAHIIAFHSARGGVGKTMLSINTAIALARRGINVAVLDMDYRQPSFHIIFGEEGVRKWTNDYLNDDCELEEILVDITERSLTVGKVFVAFSNPLLGATRRMTSKDVSFDKKTLRELLALRDANIPQKPEFFILDTGGGSTYFSLNAVAAADLCFVVTNIQLLGYESTKELLREVYTPMNAECLIVVNKAPPREAMTFRYNPRIVNFDGYEVADFIPYYEELARLQKGIFISVENADHPFSLAVENLVDRMLARLKPDIEREAFVPSGRGMAQAVETTAVPRDEVLSRLLEKLETEKDGLEVKQKTLDEEGK